MYLTKVPSLRIPIAARMRPERKVARISPSTPCAAAVADTRRMKAPAGPPIWKRLPPRSETKKPPTIAVIRPRSGETPEAMAIAMDKGRATIATVRPETTSALKAPTSYPSRSTVTIFGVNMSPKLTVRSDPISDRILSTPARPPGPSRKGGRRPPPYLPPAGVAGSRSLTPRPAP